MGQPEPVVVGVDGSRSAWDALDWAAAEAGTRGCSLRIAHACAPLVAPNPLAVVTDVAAGVDGGSEVLLRSAARRARVIAPEVEVTSSTIVGGAARALSSQPAQLLVVGTRGLGRVRSAILGSVSIAVCSRATCPVVVVPPRHDVRPSLSRTRVVVGVDGSDLSRSAIGFALAAAAQRGIGLTALHAWIPRPADGFEGLGDDWVATAAVERHRLAAALTPWRSRFPDTDIRLKLVADEPARALASEWPGAALLVVGSRGHGCVTGILFGSVSQAVVRYARCATAVVRPPATATERSPAA